MDETVSNIDTKGAPTCPRCFMMVARFAPQVVLPSGTHHRECYEAWYFGRFGKRPRLTAGTNGARHRYEARDLAA